MAVIGAKLTLLLGLLVAALVLAAAQPEDKKNKGVVTLYNPAGLVVDILNDDKNVKVTTEVATVELTDEQQNLQISTVGGFADTISVTTGDEVVLIPDTANFGNVQAFKVILVGEEPRPAVVRP